MRVDASAVSGKFIDNRDRLNFRTTKESMERLSSGLKINKGADDPSGLGIASGMRATIGGIDRAIENAQDGIRMIATMDSTLNEIQDMVLRGYELSVRAANFAVNTSDDLQKFQDEVDSIVAQIDARAATASYNTKLLLAGGDGRSFGTTTQADWNAGTVPPELDTTTTVDSMRLNLVDPMTLASKSTSTVNAVRRIVNPYVTNYVDNGDGTVDMTIRIKARSQGGSTNFDGTMSFHSSAQLVALNANVNGADNNVTWDAVNKVLDFNTGGRRIRANTTFQDEVELTLRLDKDPTAMRCDMEIVGPSGNPQTQLYFGQTLLVDGLGRYTSDAYMTDIETTGTWTGPAIDTGFKGGEAIFSWNADSPGATQVAMQLYESDGAGGPWSQLALVENGDTFSYTKQYIRAEAVLTTPGIAFGTPELHDLEIQLKQGRVLQVGENNQEDHRIYLNAYDTSSASLGLQGVDVTVSQKVIKQYDTQTEWLAGIVSNPGGLIDNISSVGNIKLASPISSQPPAQVQQTGQPNMYIRIDSSNFDAATGRYDMQMSLSVYGQNGTPNGAQALGWITAIRVFDGDGTQLQVYDVNNISTETGSIPVGGPPAGYTPGVGIGPGYTNTADAHYIDTNNDGNPDTYIGRIANGNTYGGGAGYTIYSDMGTTTAQDGVDFKFNAAPDAYIQVTFDCVGFTGGKNIVSDEACNVYFHDELIATNYDNSPLTQTITYRLQEYGTQPPAYTPPAAPTGDFTTGAFYFGAGQKGYLNVNETLNGGATTYTVEESADGTPAGAWTALAVDPTDNSFTTSSTGKYLRINGQLQGVGPTLVTNPHSYTMSTSPVVDSIIISSESNAIDDFQSANRQISQMRAEIGVVQRRLYHVVDELTMQRNNIAGARSHIMDADMAQESVNLAKAQILTDTNQALKAQGDPFVNNILDLTSEHHIGAGMSGIG